MSTGLVQLPSTSVARRPTAKDSVISLRLAEQPPFRHVSSAEARPTATNSAVFSGTAVTIPSLAAPGAGSILLVPWPPPARITVPRPPKPKTAFLCHRHSRIVTPPSRRTARRDAAGPGRAGIPPRGEADCLTPATSTTTRYHRDPAAERVGLTELWPPRKRTAGQASHVSRHHRRVQPPRRPPMPLYVPPDSCRWMSAWLLSGTFCMIPFVAAGHPPAARLAVAIRCSRGCRRPALCRRRWGEMVKAFRAATWAA